MQWFFGCPDRDILWPAVTFVGMVPGYREGVSGEMKCDRIGDPMDSKVQRSYRAAELFQQITYLGLSAQLGLCQSKTESSQHHLTF